MKGGEFIGGQFSTRPVPHGDLNPHLQDGIGRHADIQDVKEPARISRLEKAAEASFIDGPFVKEFGSVINGQARHVVVHDAGQRRISSVPPGVESHEFPERPDDVLEKVESSGLSLQDLIGGPVGQLPKNDFL